MNGNGTGVEELQRLSAQEITERNMLTSYAAQGRLGDYAAACIRGLVGDPGLPEQDARQLVLADLRRKLDKYCIECPDLDDI